MGTTIFIVLVLLAAICIPICLSMRNKKIYNEQLEQNNALAMENKAVHLSGLPATGREVCSIMVKNDNVIIKNARQEFNISMDKIIGAVVSQETRNVQTVQTTTKKKPSVGKAVVGGTLFGPAGAVVGGVSGKSKSTSNVQTRTELVKLFLTINYVSGECSKQIAFEGSPYCKFPQIQNAINSRIGTSSIQNL